MLHNSSITSDQTDVNIELRLIFTVSGGFWAEAGASRSSKPSLLGVWGYQGILLWSQPERSAQAEAGSASEASLFNLVV